MSDYSHIAVDMTLDKLKHLKLKYEVSSEYNGEWFRITRTNFDLFMLEEPYHSLVLFVNLNLSQYIFRVHGVSRERGCFATFDELESIIRSKFSDTVACVGNPGLREENGSVQFTQPFPMVVSAECEVYYTLHPGESYAVLQGRGRCRHCRRDLAADMIENIPEPVAREKQALEADKQPKKTRKMSDLTKQKISENNRKFSVCKLCNKQCRGFRGLVDHMHRDHEDYKPWRCHMCYVRTAFVKTLYRHLRQEHGASGCPCPVCGKVYTRAQSMLLHVKKCKTSLPLEEKPLESSYHCNHDQHGTNYQEFQNNIDKFHTEDFDFLLLTEEGHSVAVCEGFGMLPHQPLSGHINNPLMIKH